MRKLLPLLLLVAVGGFVGWTYLASSANAKALETASVAENRVTLAVSGMT